VIAAQDIRLSFGERILFDEVNITFTPGNCYGLIGANGAGKSTFLRILAGEQEPDHGSVTMGPGERLAVLRQDQFAFDDYPVVETVIMGHQKLYKVMKEREEIYSREDFSEEDGIRAAELEAEFGEMGGWEAEAEATTMLSGLGLDDELHQKLMGELDSTLKVRVLLAQALFGSPDVLLLDEPTNNLDLDSITWLENFLYEFANTVIVVSHDRHFLNRICTHIADIDFGKIKVFVGNYDFWYQASQLMQRQMKEQKRRNEEKAKDLKEFIQRFSSNASKARQATSRKKLLEKLSLEDLPQTSRRFPYVNFKPERECGKSVLEIDGLTIDGGEDAGLRGYDLTVRPGDKIAFVGPLNFLKTAFFDAIAGEAEPQAGTISWGQTIKPAYFPKDAGYLFETDISITEWLRQFSPNQEEAEVRGFLGRMLFSGEESLKPARVLSGGERVRCMLARMMLSGANVLVLDEPTNHLDLESITALNNGLMDFSQVVLFNSHDHQFVDSIANRIIEFTPDGVIDRMMRFDDYVSDPTIRELRDAAYHKHERVAL